MKMVIALVASMLLLAPWTGFAGSVKITVNENSDEASDIHIFTLSDGNNEITVDFPTVEPYHSPWVGISFQRPFGIVDGKLRFVESIVSIVFYDIVAFNDSNDNKYLDEGEEIDEIACIRTWNMTEVVEVDPGSMEPTWDGAWSFSISSEGGQSQSFEELTIGVIIIRETGKVSAPVPIYDVVKDNDNSTFNVHDMKTKTLRSINYSIEIDLSVDQWVPGNGTTSYTAGIGLTVGDSLEAIGDHESPFPDQSHLRSWPHIADGIIASHFPIEGHGLSSQYFNGVSSQLVWSDRHNGSMVNDSEGYVSWLLPTGYGPSHIMSMVDFLPEIGSDGFILNLHVYSLQDVEEEDPDLKLGFTFYLPLIFITTLVSATVVVNYYRRDME